MRELKVGDNVWIRDDLEVGKVYGEYGYMDLMCKGEMVTVKSVDYNDIFHSDSDSYWYTVEMVDWDKTDEYNRNKIDPNIIKCKEIFDQLIEVGFKRDEALKIMLNAGNVGKNT